MCHIQYQYAYNLYTTFMIILIVIIIIKRVLIFINYRAIILAAFCLGTCFDMLFAWMPTYFHDNYPDSQVVFQTTIRNLFLQYYKIVLGVFVSHNSQVGQGLAF